jgi:aryl-alcohol dehydrogenase-like predicted oxidoreductase
MARAESLARFGAFCQSLGQTPAAVSLAWLLHQDGIAATIIGPASRAQLASVVSVTDLKLGEDALAALDSIFPPSGPAPEAYAW